MPTVKIRALRLVMPGQGDMELVGQAGGAIDLLPIYYGNESMGPHIQIVEGHNGDDGKFIVDKVISRSRIKLKLVGDPAVAVIELKKGNDEQ